MGGAQNEHFISYRNMMNTIRGTGGNNQIKINMHNKTGGCMNLIDIVFVFI